MRYGKILRRTKIRCQACDCELTDWESTRKDAEGQYVDFCNRCYSSVKEDLFYIDCTTQIEDFDQ